MCEAESQKRLLWRLIGLLFSFFVAGLLWLSLPGGGLPTLDGPYSVAKHQWVLRSQRQDVHNPDPFAQRELLVSVYYPTLLRGEMERSVYVSPAMLDAAFFSHASVFERLFVRRRLLQWHSHAWTGQGSGISPRERKYPVVIFSPGLGWFADVHSFYLEQLASHGYMVFAITHTGQSPRVDFPDGRHMSEQWSAYADTVDMRVLGKNDEAYERTRRVLLQILDRGGMPSPEQVRSLVSLNIPLLTDYPLSVRKDDVVELLDCLQSLNAGQPASPFAGRLDMENIAITGMSYGGPTASEVCLDDARCKAVVNMDGEEFGRLPLEAGTRPALWLYRAGRWDGTPLRRVAYRNYAGPAYRVGFADAVHSTFSDQPYWPGFAMRKDRHLPPLIFRYELDFLDHYLKGHPLKYLSGASATKGAVVDTRQPE